MSDTAASEIDMASGEAAAISIPCLLLTTAPVVSASNKSAVAKKAETLYVNLRSVIRRAGEEKVGFTTLTFGDNCDDRSEAQSRYHSLDTHFFKRYALEKITVPERQERGAFHYHAVIAFPWDIRTGFDFEAYRNWQQAKHDGDKPAEQKWERKFCKSANPALKKWWQDLRNAAPKYGFGRCQTIPIIGGAEAISRYLASYVTTATLNRLPCDKGLRTVRYSMRQRAATLKFSWADGNGERWRRGLQILGMIYQLDFDGLKSNFGSKYQHEKRHMIFAFGEHFDEALQFVAQIPEWADWSSRVRFCSQLFAHFTKDKPLVMQQSPALRYTLRCKSSYWSSRQRHARREFSFNHAANSFSDISPAARASVCTAASASVAWKQ